MRTAGLISLVLIFTACSGPQERPEGHDDAQPPEGGAAEERPVGDDAVTDAVTRERLGRLLGPGPGHFFGIVNVEGVGDEVTSRFLGWRIESLPTDTPAWLDIRVGDVVTGVNGITPLEQPEDAIRVYEVLRVASEVRIDLIRDGERRALRIPILDEGESAPGPTEGTPDGGADEAPPPGDASPAAETPLATD